MLNLKCLFKFFPPFLSLIFLKVNAYESTQVSMLLSVMKKTTLASQRWTSIVKYLITSINGVQINHSEAPTPLQLLAMSAVKDLARAGHINLTISLPASLRKKISLCAEFDALVAHPAFM